MLHPAGEALHGLGVVGGVVTASAEQPDRADRGLQLVADVGDEVAPDRLDPTLAGAVLDQHQHQPGAERGDAHGQVASRYADPARVGAARTRGSARRVVPDGPGRAACRRPAASPLTTPMRVGRRGRLEHRVVSSTTSALLRSTARTAATPSGSDRLLGRASARCCWLSLTRHASTAAPPEHGAEQREQHSLRRGVHVLDGTQRVHRALAPQERVSTRLPELFTARSRFDPDASPGVLTVTRMRDAYSDQLDGDPSTT